MSERLKETRLWWVALLGAVALSGCGEKPPELLLDHCYENLEQPTEIDCSNFYSLTPVGEGGYWVIP